MNKNNLKSNACALAIVLAGLLVSACQSRQFHISGTITNAADSILYLENMSLDGAQTVDSVKLDGKGTFSFAQDAPDAPEFYRLRIANQIINLSIDSTETVTVSARYPQMTTQYDVKGSDNCKKIQELSYLQYQLQAAVMSIVDNRVLA